VAAAVANIMEIIMERYPAVVDVAPLDVTELNLRQQVVVVLVEAGWEGTVVEEEGRKTVALVEDS
jgi:hypothetical protein